MDTSPVIVAEPTPDGAACAVLAARGIGDLCGTFFFPAAELVGFFDPSTQRDLPRVYSLIICGMGLVHTSWDGKLLRPYLVQKLRDFVRPVRWFSARNWKPDDRAAVENIIGEDRLIVDPSAENNAELVRQHYAGNEDQYAEDILALAGGNAADAPAWVNDWHRIISSLKNEPGRIGEIIQPLLNGQPGEVSAELLDRADHTEQRNRELASENVSDPVAMRDYSLVRIDIPPDRHAFWREIGAYARARHGADFSLCQLLSRPVLVLSRGEEHRVDLRRWIRYVTDVVPAATAVEPRPDAVPLCVNGLTDDPGLANDVVRALKDGAHLLDD
jgi:hypothetical protein